MEQVSQLVAAGVVQLPDWTGYHKEEIQIPTRDGQSLRAITYRPESAEPGPLLLYFHGGGWTFGFPELGETWAYKFVKERGFTVVSVGYRSSPENPFPMAANDAWDAVKWVGFQLWIDHHDADEVFSPLRMPRPYVQTLPKASL